LSFYIFSEGILQLYLNIFRRVYAIFQKIKKVMAQKNPKTPKLGGKCVTYEHTPVIIMYHSE